MTWPWLIASWTNVPLTGAHLSAYCSLTTTTSAGINSRPRTCPKREAIGNVALDHEKVEVAAVVGVATRTGAEQDHLRWR